MPIEASTSSSSWCYDFAMKIVSLSLVLGLFLSIWPDAMADRDYNFILLKRMNEEKMANLVERLVAKGELGQAPIKESLMEALKLSMSRPNEDKVLNLLLSRIIPAYPTEQDFVKALVQVVKRSVDVLKNPEGVKDEIQVTHIVILENYMSYFNPQIKKSKLIKKGFEIIRDAEIKVTDEAGLVLSRNMRAIVSPSTYAKKLLPPEKKSWWDRLFG